MKVKQVPGARAPSARALAMDDDEITRGKFDFNSIMLYSSFEIREPYEAQYGPYTQHASELSPGDIATVKALY